MTEMILTREEARRINGDNIRTVFGCALEDSILKGAICIRNTTAPI